MAFTRAFYSGSKLVDSTEWSLVTDTASGPDVSTEAGSFQVTLGVQDMIAGDQLRFRFYEKERAADPQGVVHEVFLTGAQWQPKWISIPLGLGNGWDASVVTLLGTSIQITWSISKSS